MIEIKRRWIGGLIGEIQLVVATRVLLLYVGDPGLRLVVIVQELCGFFRRQGWSGWLGRAARHKEQNRKTSEFFHGFCIVSLCS